MIEGSARYECDEKPLILVIDHDAEVVDRLVPVLQEAGYRTSSAESGPTGIAIAEKYRPHIILLDLQMPGMDGLAVCEELKSRMATADIPVIFMTAGERTDDLVARCFAAGAHDFLIKPLNMVELFARLRVVLREGALLDAYRRLATQDSLTGLSNRRQFILWITEAIMSARRDGSQSVLMLADIDNLASVNERYGYELGDEVVLTFARLLKRLDSHTCKVGRIGGEEFGVALLGTTKEYAMEVANRLRQTFAAIAFDATTEPKHFSVSLGLAGYSGEPAQFTIDDFLNDAGIALSAAKEFGHGRMSSYWEMEAAKRGALGRNKRHARSRTRRRTERSFVNPPGAETAEETQSTS